MNANSQNHNQTTASATASNAQTYGTEVQKSHTRSALGSTIKNFESDIEQAINTICRRFGENAQIHDISEEGKGIDIIFKDCFGNWREYWKPANAPHYLLYKL